MAQKSFTAQVDDWVRKTEARMLAVFRMSTQFVVEDVVLGTPVETGFLRASLTVTIDVPLPMRPGYSAPSGTPSDFYPEPAYSLAILKANLGQTVYATFVAGYAVHVEYGPRNDQGAGMIRLAAQRWPQHVERAVEAAKSQVNG